MPPKAPQSPPPFPRCGRSGSVLALAGRQILGNAAFARLDQAEGPQCKAVARERPEGRCLRLARRLAAWRQVGFQRHGPNFKILSESSKKLRPHWTPTIATMPIQLRPAVSFFQRIPAPCTSRFLLVHSSGLHRFFEPPSLRTTPDDSTHSRGRCRQCRSSNAIETRAGKKSLVQRLGSDSAGEHVQSGDVALKMVIAPDKKAVVAVSAGYNKMGLTVISLERNANRPLSLWNESSTAWPSATTASNFSFAK